MTADNPAPGALWQPTIGEEARNVINASPLTEEAGNAVIDSASSILAHGVNPNELSGGGHTGLVVGYVQSGKTLSFTTATALARDNGYRLVIVVAGISTSLLNQSTGRLQKDLKLDSPSAYCRWINFINPTNASNTLRRFQQTLNEWREPSVPDNQKPTILVTVMKHHSHLANLIELVSQLDLSDAPTLIVDDEADQASLNTLINRGGRESTTYRRLLELREAVPHHTFLQYTATPQAPLLINIIDALSPNFVEVLEPGGDYIGGRTFFHEQTGLVRLIPHDDVPTGDNPITSPPSSLLEALRIFLVGVAAGLIEGPSEINSNRSMLVHPARETAQHQEYKEWIDSILDEWRRIIVLENEPDRNDLIEDFREVYADLAETVTDLPTFDEIITALPRAFHVNTEQVNAKQPGGTPTIAWNTKYGWILVGGQAMDRGFTVEGLTVTYMPRGVGVGNADTIQQRGRFFGYKRPYLNYCRTYLEGDVSEAFTQYVTHEDEMRRQLQTISNEGSSLTEWKRTFFLSPDLHPCRRNVIQYNYARGNYADRWFDPSFILDADSVMNENRETVRTVLDTLDFVIDEENQRREPAQRHSVCRNVSLRHLIENLLVPYRLAAPSDTQEITGVLLQLAHALEQDPDEQCVIYRMSPDYSRERSVNENGKLPELFQGEVPVSPRELRGSIYAGDRAMRELDQVTVQVHSINVKQDGQVVANDVPVIAIWVPRRMGQAWVVAQDQPQT